MTVAIEVDEVWRELLLECEQPVTGAGDVVPWIGHPLQPALVFVQVDRANTARGRTSGADRRNCLALCSRGSRPEHNERHANAGGCELADQVERVGPDTTDGIGGHQDVPDGAAVRRQEPVSRWHDGVRFRAPTAAGAWPPGCR